MAYPNIKNYVKFMRGTPKGWKLLKDKDPDTFYYISEPDADRGSLYLGDKLITSGKDTIVTLNSLEDVLIDEGLENKSILFFDGEHWTNKTLQELSLILGSFDTLAPGELGLVKAPEENEKEFFLRGDGVWAEVETKLDTITFAQIDALVDEEEEE